MTQTSFGKDDHSARHWYAIYTRPRFEKKVYKELGLADIETFLPLVTVTKIWSDRKKQISEPLFPSYIFVNATPRERYDALQPPGAVRVVSFNGQPVRIPSEQVEAIRCILDSGFVPTIHHELKCGTPVEIVAGPLIGLRGVVNEQRGSCNFSIFIDGICQAIAVNIEARHLKVIKKQQLNSSYMQHLAIVSAA